MSGRLDYRPGQRVHWIQARLAAGDQDGWCVARLDRVEPGWVVVVGRGRRERFYCLTEHLVEVLARRGLSVVEPRCPVGINERWNVLAFPADTGSRYLFSIAVQPPPRSQRRP